MDTAARLEQLRQQKGDSYAAIAAAVGVSASTVSHWFHGKTNPSAENLKKLADYFEVSVKYLQTGESVSLKRGVHVKNDKEEVHVSFKDGIHVHTEEDEVHVSFKDGVHVVHNGESCKKKIITDGLSTVIIGSVVLIAFLIIGFIGFWHPGWLILLMWPILNSLVDAIVERDARRFAYPVLMAFVYLSVCLIVTPIWHPLWVVFLTIPIYYCLCTVIYNAIHKQ